jgi:hypothetical protein
MDLPQQDRSNYQDQECNQEDRVANVALGSASRHRVELDSIPQGHCSERECQMSAIMIASYQIVT